jgi:hypothetical protein
VAESADAGRTHHVLVDVRGAVVVLPVESRDRLLDELRSRDDADDVIAAFDAGAGSRPVELDVYDQVVVVEAIRDMENRAGLPDGLGDLRDALVDELHEPE